MTKAAGTAPRRRLGRWSWWIGFGILPVAGVVIARSVDLDALTAVGRTLRSSPGALLLVLVVYGSAFGLRAVAWQRVLPSVSLGHALAAIHVSVGANHVLPARLGEVLRCSSVVRRAAVRPAAAIASTVSMRAADVLAVGVLAAVLGPGLALDVLGVGGPALLVLAATGVVVGGAWSRRVRRRTAAQVRIPGPVTLGLVLASWVLEGVVVHQAAAWAGIELTVAEAVLVTAVTIGAQALAIAPGGFGTYEATATAVLVAFGAPAGTALAVALTAHAVKTAYALVGGAVAAVVPAPSLFGRLRMATRPAEDSDTRPDVPAGDGDEGSSPPATRPAPGPVVLFLPARNEEAAVGAVVRRVPSQVAGHPVRCLVIDDGSTDRTVAQARAAGAEVIAMDHPSGLGAAVRRGLAEGVARDAVAVAFCDADGEYAPEELGAVLAPILDDEADYVVGSRFAGRAERMLPHRRLGNRVLTAALRYVTRAAISDGQSGYRALSRRAAAVAEVAHDYNYAQVLTVDLLARGARYAEVPISYRFRETGRSFVRLTRYLAAVVPAVHRQVNAAVAPAPLLARVDADGSRAVGGGTRA